MYICVSTLSVVKPGDILYLEKETDFGEIAVREIGGGIVGFVMHGQPRGCVTAKNASMNIGGKRIIAEVAVVMGDVALLFSHSTALLPADDKKSINRRLIYA